jgi:hypothetical protein
MEALNNEEAKMIERLAGMLYKEYCIKKQLTQDFQSSRLEPANDPLHRRKTQSW